MGNVGGMKGIKTAVGKDEALAAALVFGEFLAQHITRDEFGSGFAHDLRGGSRCLGADGLEKLFARNGGSAALHDHQAARDVGDVRGLEGRCPASESQSVSGKNGVARAGNVDGLIAAMNGDLRQPVAWLEKRRTVSPSGDQEGLQFHLGKSRAACALEFAGILTDGRVMLGLKLGLIWRRRSDARLRITVQPVTRVEGDAQRTLALGSCLLHKLRSCYAKAVVRNCKRI